VAGNICCWSRLSSRSEGRCPFPHYQDFLRVSVSSTELHKAHVRCISPLERALLYPSIGAFAGAWLGAMAFPLDWERPWQVGLSRSAHASSAKYRSPFHCRPPLGQSLAIPLEELSVGCTVRWLSWSPIPNDAIRHHEHVLRQSGP
jgi:hypothetical protein